MTIEEALFIGHKISRSGHNIPKPITEEWLEAQYTLGMIRKSDLIHGATYAGSCRNSLTAEWNSNEEVFYHIRTKFDKSFAEEINHPEDDDGFDLFIPMLKIHNQMF